MIQERIYDIVICFRMKDNESALLMKAWLDERKYSVSVCSCNFGGGSWRETMNKRVENCKDCIIIVSDDTFSIFSWFRKDYLVEEITNASINGKRIIPIIKEKSGNSFRYIPPKVKRILSQYNQIKYHYDEGWEQFELVMNKLTTGEEPFLISEPHVENVYFKPHVETPYYKGVEDFNQLNDQIRYMQSIR